MLTSTPPAVTPVHRLMISDDHPAVRQGLRALIEQRGDLEVVAEAQDGQEAINLAVATRPDLLILDVLLPKLNGIEVLRYLRNLWKWRPDLFAMPPTLILSAHSEPEYVYALFALGAKGYLLKDEPPSEILDGIYRVLRGLPAISRCLEERICRTTSDSHGLSHREREVLRLVARGYSDEEISRALAIAISTVGNHINNIYAKLPDVNSRAAAVTWAWQNRLVIRP